ncbi:ester cyclase [Natronococcus sp. A-GB1]|uniref:ester cyclase n=1 Tax=Natronococcus sp. A-GB1 TaxID=3037648 RepID=UPI00241E137D|nr:ester cyclase [Natronococcus sp. A-GB1]MDG5758187.1 ester cyclase [Natronococcus sp. A-GB1]
MSEATIQDAERLLEQYDKLWSGDHSKLDVVAESISFHSPLDEVHGRDALEEFLREQESAFPDGTVETDAALVGDEMIMHEFTWTGTHEAAFDGIEPTGRTVEVAGMATLTIDGGRIVEDRTYFDSEALLAQLGATE